ncbi:hypothetical protein QQ045_001417 [Rhodiola kirilowii]
MTRRSNGWQRHQSRSSSPPKMDTRLTKRRTTRMSKTATPTGEPLARWMELGSPEEKTAEAKEPCSEEKKWMRRRRAMGRRRRPSGLRSSEMVSVKASPWPPTVKAMKTLRTTTTARIIPCGGPAWASSSIF